MPLYEYHCPNCNHSFEKLQPMRATSADCPVCEAPARRAISVFSSVSRSESDSSPSPLPPMRGGGCCGGSCGCAH